MESCSHVGVSVNHLRTAITPTSIAQLVANQGLTTGRARLRIAVFNENHQLESGESISFIAATWPVLGNGHDAITVALGETKRQHGDPRYNYKMLGRSYVEEDLDAAAKRHCGDVIFLNNRGELCEGAYSNIWLIEPGRLLTPPLSSPCLPGITRARLISAAEDAGMEVIDEAPLPLEAVHKAIGMFLSSSIRGIQPVGAIEDYHFFAETQETEAITTLLANRLLRT